MSRGRPGTEELLSYAEQRWREGNLAYVGVAVSVCYRRGVPPPKWLVQAVTGLEVYALMTWRKRGRLGNPGARWKQHVIDTARWAAVLYHKGNGNSVTWDKAYELASADLRGTIARGTSRVMRYSYCRAARSDFIRSMQKRSEEELRNFVRSIYLWRREILKRHR